MGYMSLQVAAWALFCLWTTACKGMTITAVDTNGVRENTVIWDSRSIHAVIHNKPVTAPNETHLIRLAEWKTFLKTWSAEHELLNATCSTANDNILWESFPEFGFAHTGGVDEPGHRHPVCQSVHRRLRVLESEYELKKKPWIMLLFLEMAGQSVALGCRYEGLRTGTKALEMISQLLGREPICKHWLWIDSDAYNVPRHLWLDSTLAKPQTWVTITTQHALLASYLILQATCGMCDGALLLSLDSPHDWDSTKPLEHSDSSPPHNYIDAPLNNVAAIVARACCTLARLTPKSTQQSLWRNQCVDVYEHPNHNYHGPLLAYFTYLSPALGSLEPFRHGHDSLGGPAVFLEMLSVGTTQSTLQQLWTPPYSINESHALLSWNQNAKYRLLWLALVKLYSFEGFPYQDHAVRQHRVVWPAFGQHFVGLLKRVEERYPTPLTQAKLRVMAMRAVILALYDELNLGPQERNLEVFKEFSERLYPRLNPFVRAPISGGMLRRLHSDWRQKLHDHNQFLWYASPKVGKAEGNSNTSAKVVLFVDYFIHYDSKRREEILECMKNNLDEAGFDTVYVRVDSLDALIALRQLESGRIRGRRSATLVIIEDMFSVGDNPPQQSRLSPAKVFEWVASYGLDNHIVVMGNSDILFPRQTLATLKDFQMNLFDGASVISLTRFGKDRHDQGFLSTYSQDVWAMKTPLVPPLSWESQLGRCKESLAAWPQTAGKDSSTWCRAAPSVDCKSSALCTPVNLNFPLGFVYSDARMNWAFWVMGFDTINPLFQLIVIHNHAELGREEDYFENSIGPPGMKSFFSFIEDIPLDDYATKMMGSE